MENNVVSRVFCYSEKEAKKTGNNLSIGKMLLQIFLIVIVMMITFFLMLILLDDTNEDFILIYTFIFIGVIIFYAIKQRGKIQAQLTGLAISNNNLYIVKKLNNGENLFIGGMAVGSILENFNQTLGDSVKGIGSIASLYALNKSAKIMRNPEIIAKIVELSNQTTGAIVLKILKIYSFKENNKKVQINCDYMIMGNQKIKQNKKITIYKSYNCMDDLIKILKGGQNALQ